MRAALVMVLRLDGFQVQMAANGEDALEQLRSGSRPSLILLDLIMPVMDGFQFRAQQRRDPQLANIPVIVISGSLEMRRRMDALQAIEYIDKPIDPTTLLEVIHRHCRPR